MTDTLRDLATKALEVGERATKGPWYYPADGREIVKTCKGGYPVTQSIGITHAQALANNAFIAFARDALPRLAEGYLNLDMRLKAIAEIDDHFATVLARLAIAREALEFYATPEHWAYEGRPEPDNKAREALEKIK